MSSVAITLQNAEGGLTGFNPVNDLAHVLPKALMRIRAQMLWPHMSPVEQEWWGSLGINAGMAEAAIAALASLIQAMGDPELSRPLTEVECRTYGFDHEFGDDSRSPIRHIHPINAFLRSGFDALPWPMQAFAFDRLSRCLCYMFFYSIRDAAMTECPATYREMVAFMSDWITRYRIQVPSAIPHGSFPIPNV